jgi:DNA-binding MarR family transcriptional regulator
VSRPRQAENPARLRLPGAAFLLSQVGFHSSRLWRERLGPLGVDPREIVVLRHVAAQEGCSQHSLSMALRIPPSRIVALADQLERKSLLERRPNANDRRAHALHLTRKGRNTLDLVMDISRQHESQLCAGLGLAERRQLVDLLSRIAARQGLVMGVHPGVGEPAPPSSRESSSRE